MPTSTRHLGFYLSFVTYLFHKRKQATFNYFMDPIKDNFKVRNAVDETTGFQYIDQNEYKKMMYRWGAGSILHLQKWYEFIEYYEGCMLIEQAILRHNLLVNDNLPLRLDS